MPNAPHVHTIDEAKRAINHLEHNASGQGPGPSGKKGGPPTAIEGGSIKNRNAGHNGHDSTIPGKEA